MIVVGIALIAVAAAFVGLWGPLRVLFVLAGIVIVIAGFLLMLGVTKLKIGASGDGGIEASADMPTGYTKTMTVSGSLVEGSIPSKRGAPLPKEGAMPPKDGVMPPKTADERLRQPARPDSGGSAQDRPQSSAKP
jgi:hypothetical protein